MDCMMTAGWRLGLSQVRNGRRWVWPRLRGLTGLTVLAPGLGSGQELL